MYIIYFGNSNKTSFDNQISRDRLVGLSGILDGSAFRVAAGITVLALAGLSP